MRYLLPFCLVLASVTGAAAQQASSDPTGVCAFINFAFCPQPAPPPPPLPDPNALPTPTRASAPVASVPVHHKRHRQPPQG